MKNTIADISFLLLGAAIGTAVGLALAPKPGAELRAEVKDRALDLIGRPNERPREERVHA